MATVEDASSMNVEELLAAKAVPLDGLQARANVPPPGLAPTLLTSKAVVINDATAEKLKAAKQESSKQILYSRIGSFASTATTASQGAEPPKVEGEEPEDEKSASDPENHPPSGDKSAAGHEIPLPPVAPTAAAASEAAGDRLPSLGSGLHAAGKCSPCYFQLKRRCRNGANCQFCHLQHERRSRARGCRGHGSNRAEAPLQAVAPPGLLAASHHLAMGARIAAPPGLGVDPVQASLLHMPPVEPPRGLPMGAHDFVPPAPESSPGASYLQQRSSAAAAGAAAVAATLRTLGIMQPACPSAAGPSPAPPQQAGRKQALLATQPVASWPPQPQPQPQQFGSWPRTPGAEVPTDLVHAEAQAQLADLMEGAVELPPTPKGPILATAPAPELPRLLGRARPKQGQPQQPPATRPSIAETLAAAEKTCAELTSTEIEAPRTPASEPAKVLMPGYGCKVPPLDPLAPVKKRVPEWSV